jgi:hypothetical protein
VGGKVQEADNTWTARVLQYALTGGLPAMSMAYDGLGTWGPCWVDAMALSGADGLFVAGSGARPPTANPCTWDVYTTRIVR